MKFKTMKTHMAGLEREFSTQATNEPVKGQRVNPRRRLKCGVREGALVRIYREHHIRFGIATQGAKRDDCIFGHRTGRCPGHQGLRQCRAAGEGPVAGEHEGPRA